MDAEHWLRTQMRARDPGPAFTAGLMRRVRAATAARGRRKGVRFTVVGLIAALAMAATMLAVKVFDAPGADATVASGSVATPTLSTRQVAPIAAADPALLAPQDAVQAPPPTIPASAVEAAPVLRDPAAAFRVLLMPLRQDQPDPAAREPVEAFYAALLAELGKVPGIVLVAPDDQEAQTAQVRVAVISLAGSASPNGGMTYRLTQSQGSISYNTRAPDFGTHWPLEFDVQVAGKGSGMKLGVGIDGVLSLARPDVPRPRICSAPIVPRSSESLCMTPVQLAARQVEYLRLRVFPPDPALHRQMLARIADRSATERVRHTAFFEVVSAHKEGRGFPPDAEAIRAIASLAADTASLRGQIWSQVRGFAHPGLVEPLLDSLHTDPEETIRLEALSTLLVDYGGDGRVASALERAGRENSSELVRMLARRATSGEGVWREYVVAKLRDGTQSPEQRAAPLRHSSDKAFTPEQRAAAAVLANDPEVIDAVLQLARDGRAETDLMQRAAVRHSLNALKLHRDTGSTDSRWQEVDALYAEYAGNRALPAQVAVPQ